MTILEIELAVANMFGIYRHLIVPNVSSGLGLHECDILIVTKNGFCTEIEIKTSIRDLKRDLLKPHGHRSNLIKRLFFAVPDGLSIEFIPNHAGIIVVKDLVYGYYAQINRPAKINKSARPLTQNEWNHLGMLASMRIWPLKEVISDRWKRRNYDHKIEYCI